MTGPFQKLPPTATGDTAVDTYYDVSSNQDPDFVNRMRMHSQETPQPIIESELLIVRTEGNLSSTDEITFVDEGWDSRVYLINGGETAYKFPRAPSVAQDYPQEIAALKMLDGIGGGVLTQRFIMLDPANRYFSYSGVVGTQLSELLESLSVEDKIRAGSIVGSFLNLLHGQHIEGAPVTTVENEISEYQAKYQLALPIIEASFSAHEQQRVATFFLDFMPSEMRALGCEMRLCHGDLGSYNIVLGDDRNLGIIDFGNVGYYDPSKDFIDFGDEVVLDAALEAYGDSANLRAKIDVRSKALTVIDLVYYINKEDDAGLIVTVGKLHSILPNLIESSADGSENV